MNGMMFPRIGGGRSLALPNAVKQFDQIMDITAKAPDLLGMPRIGVFIKLAVLNTRFGCLDDFTHKKIFVVNDALIFPDANLKAADFIFVYRLFLAVFFHIFHLRIRLLGEFTG